MSTAMIPSIVSMDSRELAKFSGKRHHNVLRDIEKMIKALPELIEIETNSNVSSSPIVESIYIGNNNEPRKTYILDKHAVITLVTGWSAPLRYRISKRLEELELSHNSRQPASPVSDMPIISPAMAVDMQFASMASAILRLSDTSKLRMLTTVAENHGASTNLLPSYTDEKLTRALGDLLKDHGSQLSARAANPILMALGYLEERERRGAHSSTKRFKSITEAGLTFGKNETSPQNPNQTQPRYYVERFPALLDQINAWFSEGARA